MTIMITGGRGGWVVGVSVRSRPGQDRIVSSVSGQTAKIIFEYLRILHILFGQTSICSHCECL